MTDPTCDPADLAAWLFDRARDGDVAVLAYVDAGAPVNMINANGDTLLMLAAYHGHAELVAGLLERGADHGIVNDRGQSVLAGAIFKKEMAVVEALLDAGADLDLGTPSPRQTAQMFGVDLDR